MILETKLKDIAWMARKEGLEKGRNEGRKEGRKEGHEDGIRALVSTLRGLSIGSDIAVRALIQQYGLSPEQAAEKIAQYWS